MELQCDICRKKYRSKTWYDAHVSKAHPKTTPAGVSMAKGSGSDSVEGKLLVFNTQRKYSVYPYYCALIALSSATGRSPQIDDEDDFEDLEAEAAAEVAASKTLNWEDWSGTDDDDEAETYCRLIMDPWREEEAEERRREARAGLAPVEEPSKRAKKSTPPALVNCPDCTSTFTTLDGFFKHCVGHGMEGNLKVIRG